MNGLMDFLFDQIVSRMIASCRRSSLSEATDFLLRDGPRVAIHRRQANFATFTSSFAIDRPAHSLGHRGDFKHHNRQCGFRRRRGDAPERAPDVAAGRSRGPLASMKPASYAAPAPRHL
jgi:hypothetical protein